MKSKIVFLFIALSIVSIEAEELKVIEPVIGYTPDISVNAKQNLTLLKKQVDSVVNSHPDYMTAVKHLTATQLFIYENFEDFSEGDHLYVGAMGCSWYCGGGPNKITASSVLPPNKDLDYVPENIHDFSLRTAWVEGKAGYGIGESITFRFEKNSPPVTAVEIFNGYMKSDALWLANSRVKQLKLYIDNKPYAILNLKDIKSKQIFYIDTLQGTKSDLFLKFEIVDVYKGDKYDDVAISELEFDGIGVHCFAKGTMIATPDGQIEIEKLTVGSKVLSYNEQTKRVETSTVEKLASIEHDNLYELNFSGTTITVTDDHPFYHNGQYYSVVENNKYGVQTKQLRQGQAVNFLADGQLRDMELTSMRKLDTRETTYTITRLDRNRLFFANGACVAVE
jgi:Protein of unknown function (DUF1557).